MTSIVYPIINAILCGLTFIEIGIQIIHTILTKQQNKSEYFKFLTITCVWTFLRGFLSLYPLYDNEKISQTIIYMIYPCVLASFLFMLRYYVNNLYQSNIRLIRVFTTSWYVILILEYSIFTCTAVCVWTRLATSLFLDIIEIVGMTIPIITSSLQLILTLHYKVTISDDKTRKAILFEITLNILILFHFIVDLLNILHVVQIAFTPDNLLDIAFVFILEIIPIQLLLLLVHNFRIKPMYSIEEDAVPEGVISEFMDQSIVVSNPLLDYAFNKQDVENMMIATSRSHKDSEDLSSLTTEVDLSNPALSLNDKENSIGRTSPSDGVGTPLLFCFVCDIKQ